ncbi:putative AC9 transposase [Fusarium oxysporum f. sp. rapae]|uniref:Putative AC9 transposase n=1 Tax=Fusarium oxysporum f. sp. rapae TaxID=485398 RepID=A0A8J5PH96_FUSOX|nr:putative AC9 transposase [Fusarium oxysporum f. sp. rapae]
MSSASPAPLLSEPSDELLGPASPGSPVPAKRTLDRSPSDRAGKRAKGRTNKSTWNEARGPYEERGEKARDASYHEIWYCKHCNSTKKPNSVTTNLSRARKHLRDFHGIRVIEHVERSDLKKQQHGTITDLFGRQEERQANRDLNEEKYLANAINIPAFEEALARLLAVRNIAHTFIEYPEFHAVILSCNYMARDVLLRSRRAVPKLLKKSFAQHKQGLVKELHNSLSSMVHFTIDMWTSSEQKAAYQAIVVHFVDAETRGVAQALLSLREFKGSHNGKLQAKAFLEVVEEYDLRGKVGYFTMDNHDANDTMLGDIAREIDGLDPVARRLRCSGHIMNLIVQAFLFRSKAKKIQEDEREGIDEAGPRFYARFHVAWLKFEKYYQLTEQAPVYVADILLHPALRKSYLSEQWKRNPAWVSNAVKAVRKIWSTEYKIYELLDKQEEKGQELDEFDRWRQKVYSTASEVKDEFDRFIYGSQVGIGQQTALQWWLEPTQRENFPLLCRMAIDIFCIPPMSTEAERIFSGARRQVRWDRSSMSAKMVEASLTRNALSLERQQDLYDHIIIPAACEAISDPCRQEIPRTYDIEAVHLQYTIPAEDLPLFWTLVVSKADEFQLTTKSGETVPYFKCPRLLFQSHDLKNTFGKETLNASLDDFESSVLQALDPAHLDIHSCWIDIGARDYVASDPPHSTARRGSFTVLWKSQCHSYLHEQISRIGPESRSDAVRFQKFLLRDIGDYQVKAKRTRATNPGHPHERRPGVIRAKAYGCHKELFSVMFSDYEIFGSGFLPLLALSEKRRGLGLDMAIEDSGMLWIPPSSLDWYGGHIALEILVQLYIPRNPFQRGLVSQMSIQRFTVSKVAIEVCLRQLLEHPRSEFEHGRRHTAEELVERVLRLATENVARAYHQHMLSKLKLKWEDMRKEFGQRILPRLERLEQSEEESARQTGCFVTAQTIWEIYDEAWTTYVRTRANSEVDDKPEDVPLWMGTRKYLTPDDSWSNSVFNRLFKRPRTSFWYGLYFLELYHRVKRLWGMIEDHVGLFDEPFSRIIGYYIMVTFNSDAAKDVAVDRRPGIEHQRATFFRIQFWAPYFSPPECTVPMSRASNDCYRHQNPCIPLTAISRSIDTMEFQRHSASLMQLWTRLISNND